MGDYQKLTKQKSNKMICLHCVNVSWTGGINGFIMDFAKAFPEFQHQILFLSDHNEDYNLYKVLQTQGIRCYYKPEITAELIDEINPKILIIHNPPLSMYPKKIKDLKILQKCYSILFHHAKTKLFPNVIELDIFNSQWVADMYKDWEQYIKKSKIVHPAIDGTPYLNIKREYTKKKDVMIGRIQSNTNHVRGKFSEDVKMLKKLKNANFFLVGTGYEETADKRFTFAPIKVGKMPNYLSKLDIFYVWGGKGHVESWSRVVSEAMMGAIPVVVKNNHDGLAEQAIKSKACFLVNTKKEFIKIMQKLIDDPKLRKKHGELGRKWASENITIKNLRQDLIEEMFEFGVN